MQDSAYEWWQTGIIYQVYPRSFQDSDGDGVGDLAGIARRLPYLQELGVDAVWISPIYPSPMADFGYDVSDYTGIHPLFGTLADFDRLVTEAHGRGLKVILDWVPNHSSSEHPWFRESRSSRGSSKRDWYFWRDAAPGGGPPNNWLSYFGGGAWEWDDATGQYYLHSFLPEQPDLNWRNPEVRAAMYDTLRYWLDRGVDGFRLDVLPNIVKDEQLRDNPRNPDWKPGDWPFGEFEPVHFMDQPEVHERTMEIRAVLDEYPERVSIGEIYLPFERLVRYYGEGGLGIHLPFNFSLIQAERWHADTVAPLVDAYEAALPVFGWPNWVLGNHDQHRVASRVGAAQARVAAMLLLTLRGTPTIYYGDELGMADVAIPPDRVQDPVEQNLPGMGEGRDPERTPMRWDAGPNAGFSTGEPWLPIGPDHERVNVEAERGDPTSMLTLHRRLIELRRREPALHVGAYHPVPRAGDVVAYTRTSGDRRFLVALNLGGTPQTVPHTAGAAGGHVALSTHLDREGEEIRGELFLRADEGVVVELW